MEEIPISTFYDREFKAVLDILIEQYNENLEKCLEKVRSLFTIFLPPLRSDHEDDVFNDLLGLFPKNTPDIAAFIAEFEIFVNAISEKSGVNTFKEAAEQAEKMRRIFPINHKSYLSTRINSSGDSCAKEHLVNLKRSKQLCVIQHLMAGYLTLCY